MEVELLSFFYQVARKRWRQIATVSCIGVILAAVFAKHLPTRYEAIIKLYANLEPDVASSMSMPNFSFGGVDRDAFITSQEALLRSYPVYQKVQEKFHDDAEVPSEISLSIVGRFVWSIQEVLFGEDYVNTRRLWKSNHFIDFKTRTSLVKDGDSGNFMISFTDTDADNAIQKVHYLATALIELNQEIASSEAEKTVSFLEQNLIEANHELEESGKKIESFVSSNNYLGSSSLIDKRFEAYFDEQKKAMASRLELINAELTLKTSGQLLDSLRKRIKESRSDTSNAEAQALLEELQAYETSLVIHRGKNNSRAEESIKDHLQILKKELERVSSEGGQLLGAENMQTLLLDLEQANQKAKLTAQLARAQYSFTSARLEKSSLEVSKLPGLQTQLSAMMLAHNQKMKMADLIAEQFLMAKMRSKVAFNKLFLLEEPVLNTDNVSTNKAKQLATMIMIFILGVVAIYGLHDYLRGSILSKHQITDNKGHIYLGAIGHIKNFESVNLVLKSRQNDTIMRMSYQLKKRGDQGQTDNGRVITISSSFPMSGKSFTSLALGVGLSARGQSTCIIDCDFRAKSRNVRKYSTQKNQTVRSYQNVHELLIKTCVSDEKFNFCISPLLDNDVAIEEAQSFLNEEFAAIIDQLKTKFDYVILDSPPLNFPEALILAELATSIVICLPEGEMTRRQFDQTLESIEPHRRPNTKIFTVLTNCRFNEDHPNRHYRQYQEQNVA